MRRYGRRAFLTQSAALGSLGLVAGCGMGRSPFDTLPHNPMIGMAYTQRPVGPYSEASLLQDRLAELGWYGPNAPRLEIRSGDGTPSKLAEVAAELVALRCDVVVTTDVQSALAHQAATSSIPLVFVGIDDPVGLGMVSAVERPGGNITGVAKIEHLLTVNRLVLIQQMMPSVGRLDVLWEPNLPGSPERLAATSAAAQNLGIQIRPLALHRSDDLRTALAAVRAAMPDALLIFGGPLTLLHVADIAACTRAWRLPSIHDAREYVVAGGLFSYGVHDGLAYRRVAGYVDAILKGAKPADLPVEVLSTFKRVVNVQTARRIAGTESSTVFEVSADERIA